MSISGRFYQTVQALSSRLRIIAGTVAIGAAGAVGAQTGRGFSVVRTGTGAYTVTLAGSGNANVLYSSVINSVDTAAGGLAHVRKTDPAARTLSVVTSLGGAPGTPADPPSGSVLSFVLLVNDGRI